MASLYGYRTRSVMCLVEPYLISKVTLWNVKCVL